MAVAVGAYTERTRTPGRSARDGFRIPFGRAGFLPLSPGGFRYDPQGLGCLVGDDGRDPGVGGEPTDVGVLVHGPQEAGQAGGGRSPDDAEVGELVVRREVVRSRPAGDVNWEDLLVVGPDVVKRRVGAHHQARLDHADPVL